MRAAAVVVLCAGLAVQAEEIRIEVARGQRAARIEAGGRNHALAVVDSVLTVDGKAVASAEFPGPVRVDGRELPGRLEVFIDRGALVAVNAVDLEQYVAAVVASEVPPKWKVAQGPGARAHLGSSVLDQVYRNAARPPQPALDAARSTAGEVLTYGAAPIAAWFSASCGGVSESAEAAFHLEPGAAPYIRGGDSDDDRREWTVRLPLAEITAALRKAQRIQAEIRGVAVETRTASGRAKDLALATFSGTRPLSAVELRQLLGYNRIPSLLFEVSTEGATALFRGRGSGHGVGLCQWGARSRALAGAGYRDILAHYYPDAEVRRMY
ncbi:MAG: SpoIID/LytB domain-containing protein [Deltaproteobacteria bacterium]|nr:MAG: SpoIID/LytB domain-containing protein [Deltaproteobacteria bacterium]